MGLEFLPATLFPDLKLSFRVMQKNIILLAILLLSSKFVFPISIQLSGFVRDKVSNETLIGANILEHKNKSGTTTDNRGYFNIKVTPPCTLTISYVGYRNETVQITSERDSLLIINLDSDNSLDEITITTQRENQFDGKRLSSKDLLLIPSMTGKPDVMKALQLTPGVQTQSEGLSLMMVRGGEPGQNQYLLDNVPLIYVNHLGGFMSVFNPDMINTVDLYKGNFPARHGGKLSSIVDITQREGDVSKHQGSFSIGITDASVTFEGPLCGSKMSYIVTARKTFIDAFFALITSITEENSSITSYGFHDFNTKLTWKPNEKNNISLNLYQGDDYLNYWAKPWSMPKDESSHSEQKWGNWLISGRWNSVISQKLYAENILSYSRYRNKFSQQYKYLEDGKKQEVDSENSSSVGDFSFRTAWKLAFVNNWNIEFGGQVSSLLYEPSYIYNSSSKTPALSQQSNSFESAVYLDNKIKLLPGLLFQPSIRFSDYFINNYSFSSIEPRINLWYKTSPNHSFNLNFMRVSQCSHLVFTQSMILKKEIWLPATQYLPPQISNQLSASWNASFFKKKISTEVNVYYKKMEHLAALKEGYENMFGITGIENKMANEGTGIAYGTEFSITKNSGKWKGSASYCWSHATRQFATINNGKPYEFDFNHPHSINLTLNRELGKNWNVNFVWIFQSGVPYTPALGKQFTLDAETEEYTSIELIYGEKNSERMQPYHRLDIGFNHSVTTKRGNKAVWTYSIYNAYNRINPYNYYYDNDNDRENTTYSTQPLKQYKIGLFCFMPSISYKVFFDYTKTSTPRDKNKKKKNSWLYLPD